MIGHASRGVDARCA